MIIFLEYFFRLVILNKFTTIFFVFWIGTVGCSEQNPIRSQLEKIAASDSDFKRSLNMFKKTIYSLRVTNDQDLHELGLYPTRALNEALPIADTSSCKRCFFSLFDKFAENFAKKYKGKYFEDYSNGVIKYVLGELYFIKELGKADDFIGAIKQYFPDDTFDRGFLAEAIFVDDHTADFSYCIIIKSFEDIVVIHKRAPAITSLILDYTVLGFYFSLQAIRKDFFKNIEELSCKGVNSFADRSSNKIGYFLEERQLGPPSETTLLKSPLLYVYDNREWIFRPIVKLTVDIKQADECKLRFCDSNTIYYAKKYAMYSILKKIFKKNTEALAFSLIVFLSAWYIVYPYAKLPHLSAVALGTVLFGFFLKGDRSTNNDFKTMYHLFTLRVMSDIIIED